MGLLAHYANLLFHLIDTHFFNFLRSPNFVQRSAHVQQAGRVVGELHMYNELQVQNFKSCAANGGGGG